MNNIFNYRFPVIYFLNICTSFILCPPSISHIFVNMSTFLIFLLYSFQHFRDLVFQGLVLRMLFFNLLLFYFYVCKIYFLRGVKIRNLTKAEIDENATQVSKGALDQRQIPSKNKQRYGEISLETNKKKFLCNIIPTGSKCWTVSPQKRQLKFL